MGAVSKDLAGQPSCVIIGHPLVKEPVKEAVLFLVSDHLPALLSDAAHDRENADPCPAVRLDDVRLALVRRGPTHEWASLGAVIGVSLVPHLALA